MDVLNWFVNLEHVLIMKYSSSLLAVFIIVNFITNNNNIAVLFLLIFIIGLFDDVGGHYLIAYLNTEENLNYRWFQFFYFAIFNVLIILSIYKRKKILTLFNMDIQYQLYFQEVGIVLIAVISLTIQLVSMANWIIFYASGEYSLFIHGLYATVQTILLGLKYIILITLTLQNIFGELIRRKKGVLSA